MTSIPSAEGVREQAFERSGNSGSRAAWWFVGGAALIAFTMVGFVLAILSDAGQFMRHAMTTLPAIMAVAAISAGVGALRTPRRVVVDDRGIRIHFPGRSLTLAWSDIGWAATGTGIMNSSLHLALFDKEGKRLAIISQGLGDFDTLVDVVMQQVSSTAGDEAEAIRMRKAKRSAVLVIAGALGLLGVAGANAWFAYDEQRSVSLLASAGVPGEAVILDRFIAPNGVPAASSTRLPPPPAKPPPATRRSSRWSGNRSRMRKPSPSSTSRTSHRSAGSPPGK